MSKKLGLTQKTMYELKTLLLNNENIRKLLVYDQSNALSITAPSIQEAAQHFSFFPISDMGIKNYDKNTLMSLHCITIRPEEGEDTGGIHLGFGLTIVSTRQVWELDDNKIRLLELISLILEELEGKKLSLPTPLEIFKVDDIILDDSRVGYMIKIYGADLQKNITF